MRAERKRRTREHVIADLSANHVERFVLRAGHVPIPMVRDYGYDLAVFTHDANGEAEDGIIFIQLKASDRVAWRDGDDTAAQVIEARDLRRWRTEIMPVILILYDAAQDMAYWLHVQSHLNGADLPDGQSTRTLRLSRQNVVDEAALETFRRLKPGA